MPIPLTSSKSVSPSLSVSSKVGLVWYELSSAQSFKPSESVSSSDGFVPISISSLSSILSPSVSVSKGSVLNKLYS